MCGIWGSTRRFDEFVIRKKLKQMNYRGPDHSSFSDYGSVQLGHNRLAITDPNPSSHMPFEKDGLVIVFNGEIYNYQELKYKYLRDVKFLTQSDTEVILELYRKMASKCLRLLNGMFSFVIYNVQKQILFGARDRFGIKPLYYSWSDSSFEFSSQPAPLLIGNNFGISNNSVRQYLIWTYVPEPESIYDGVKKITAGHKFEYDLNKRKFAIERYFDHKQEYLNGTAYPTFEKKEILNHFHGLLEKSVLIRIPTGHQLGLALSGGIDSSLIAAICKKNQIDFEAFNVSFEDSRFDENTHAARVSDWLGIKLNTIIFRNSDIRESLLSLPQSFDEPFADSSALPSLFLFRHISESCKVVFTGDGADELFFGYFRYQKFMKGDWSLKMDELMKLLRWNVFKSDEKRNIYWDSYKKYISEMTSTSGMQEVDWLEFSPSEYIPVGNMELNQLPFFRKMMLFDVENYLPNDILTKIDRSSNRYSIEARSPFLDFDLFQESLQLDIEDCFKDGTKKILLREMLNLYFPSGFFEREKMGFSVPINTFLQTEGRDILLDYLTESNLNQFECIDSKSIIRIRDGYLKGKGKLSRLMYSLVQLFIWNDYRKNSLISQSGKN